VRFDCSIFDIVLLVIVVVFDREQLLKQQQRAEFEYMVQQQAINNKLLQTTHQRQRDMTYMSHEYAFVRCHQCRCGGCLNRLVLIS
jgi:hypothetical protein